MSCISWMKLAEHGYRCHLTGRDMYLTLQTLLKKYRYDHNECDLRQTFQIIILPQKACPQWKDTRAIVALLRQCNYSVEDCVSIFTSLNDDG